MDVATSRASRRAETARRLRWRALELTRDRGFDGWTMDDLADTAGVSRRTVFNYYDGKADVVLGPPQAIDASARSGFVAGGPTGRLFDDLVHFATEAVQEKVVDLELERMVRRVVRDDARLIGIVHQRFLAITDEAVDLLLEREGEEFGIHQARLVVQLLVTVFDNVLERFDPAADRPFPEQIADAVAEARAVLND